jgi:hypothetical protein
MFIRKLALLAAVAVLGSLAVGAAPSSAATFLHDNVTSGSLLPAGTTIMPRRATGDAAVLTLPGFGTVTCIDNTFHATVGASGGATVTGTLHGLTFTECTDTIPLLTISSCHMTSVGPSITVTATSHNGGTITINDITVKCNTGGNTGCYYTAATATGNANNTGATLAYNNIGVVHTTGSGDLGGICGNTASFSTTFTDLTSGGTGRTVVLNQTA